MDDIYIFPPEEPEDPELEPAPLEVIIPAEDEPRGGSWLRRLIYIVIALLVIVSFVSLGGGAVLFDVAREYYAERQIEAALDNFMSAMSRQEARTAYGFFSEDFQQQVSLRSIHAMLNTDEFARFDGYQSLEITDLDIVDGRSHQAAYITGRLYYAGGYEGSFTAEMIKEAGGWRLTRITIDIPPQKWDAYRSQPV